MVKYYVKCLTAGFAIGFICFYIVENIYKSCGFAFAAAMAVGIVLGEKLGKPWFWFILLSGSAVLGCGLVTAVFAGGFLYFLCGLIIRDQKPVLGINVILASLGLISAGAVIAYL